MHNRILYLSILLGVLIIAGILLFSLYLKLDTSALAAILGALVVAIVSLMGQLINAWDKSKETEEKIRARVASHALDLTKMDYELRQQSLAQRKESQEFLAPVKVYRELYKALLEYEKKGVWPKNTEELGLLNMFTLGENKPKPTRKQEHETTK